MSMKDKKKTLDEISKELSRSGLIVSDWTIDYDQCVLASDFKIDIHICASEDLTKETAIQRIIDTLMNQIGI